MAKHCEDCGTKLERGGVCPSCHEELFIHRFNGDAPIDWSAEFMAKVNEQQQAVEKRKAGGR